MKRGQGEMPRNSGITGEGIGGRGAGSRARGSEQRGAETDSRGERISQSGCLIHGKTEEAREWNKIVGFGARRVAPDISLPGAVRKVGCASVWNDPPGVEPVPLSIQSSFHLGPSSQRLGMGLLSWVGAQEDGTGGSTMG